MSKPFDPAALEWQSLVTSDEWRETLLPYIEFEIEARLAEAMLQTEIAGIEQNLGAVKALRLLRDAPDRYLQEQANRNTRIAQEEAYENERRERDRRRNCRPGRFGNPGRVF